MGETDRKILLSFLESHPADAARVLEGFESEDATALLEEVPEGFAAAVLEQMAPASGSECLRALPAEKAGSVLGQLDLDSAAGLLRRLDPEIRTALLESVPEDSRYALRRIIAYPEGTAGSYMDPKVQSFPLDISAGEALERLRRSPRFAIYYLYVTDRAGKLVGVLNLRELLLAAPDRRLEQVMHRTVSRLTAGADRTVILAHPGWSEFHAMPVVDSEGKLLGAIRYETLRRLETEAEARGGETPVSVAVSLGELYWIGLTGLLEGMTNAISRSREKQRQHEPKLEGGESSGD